MVPYAIDSDQFRQNSLSQIPLSLLFPAVNVVRLPPAISSTMPSLQTIQSPCINALCTSSLFTASTSSDRFSPWGFLGLTTTLGGTFGIIVIFALRRRSGEVSSKLGRVVLVSDRVDFCCCFVAVSDFVAEYVDRTRLHVSPPLLALDLAHSYLSYLPTKIHPPPSPLLKSTCHFPSTPCGSRSNLHSRSPVSVSMTLVFRTE